MMQFLGTQATDSVIVPVILGGEYLRGRRLRYKLADCDLAVLGDVYLVRSGFQVGVDQLPIGKNVIHHQDV